MQEWAGQNSQRNRKYNKMFATKQNKKNHVKETAECVKLNYKNW